MNLFKHITQYKSILLSLCVLSFFTACKNQAEFNGDILAALTSDTSTTISFKKDRNSPVAFVQNYTIGGNYPVKDLH